MAERLWQFAVDPSETRPIYLPTEEEIQRECERIQQSWAARDWRIRLRVDWRSSRWTVPEHTSSAPPGLVEDP
jgi:hypothetical protein